MADDVRVLRTLLLISLLLAGLHADLQAAKPLKRAPETPGFGAPAHGGRTGDYAKRAEVEAWLQAFATAQKLEPARVRAWLAEARYQRRAAQLLMPGAPGSRKNWAAYRDRFIEPRRLQAGLRFWEENAAALTRAEAQTGVPAALIAGIVGVETFYGQHMGSFRVLDVLATLAFDFPGGRSDRSAFFRDELGAFLLLALAEEREAAGFKGSFAGAMGLGQFMPSSWRAYALDFDGDGHIDLQRNAADAIGSIANFLLKHGWRPGQPTHLMLDTPPLSPALQALLAKDLEPSADLDALLAAGISLSETQAAQVRAGAPWAVQQLENDVAPVTSLITAHNFWVVTRYNRSSYYALAVLQLGERLQQLREAR